MSMKEWSDREDVLRSVSSVRRLYAKLPDNNAVERDKRVGDWIRLIKGSSAFLKTVWFSVPDLKARFKEAAAEPLTPLCLEDVVDQMYRTKQIQDYETFVNDASATQSWGSWVVSTASSMLVNSLFQSKLKLDGKFVLMDLVKERAEQLYDTCTRHKKEVLLVQDLQDLFRAEFASNEDIQLVIVQLVKSRKACTFDVVVSGEQKQAIKFSTEQATEADRGLLHLRIVSKMLEKQKIDIEAKIKECTEQARKFLKQKDIAIKYMAKRKRLQDVLMKRISSMDTLLEIMEKIEEAHTNREMLDAYTVGTNTLKDTTKRLGLDVDSVNSVMSDLADVLADQKEIDEAMISGVQSLPGADDSEELEEELEQLMKSEATQAHSDKDIDEVVSQLSSMTVANSPLPQNDKQQSKLLA